MTCPTWPSNDFLLVPFAVLAHSVAKFLRSTTRPLHSCTCGGTFLQIRPYNLHSHSSLYERISYLTYHGTFYRVSGRCTRVRVSSVGSDTVFMTRHRRRAGNELSWWQWTPNPNRGRDPMTLTSVATAVTAVGTTSLAAIHVPFNPWPLVSFPFILFGRFRTVKKS